MGTVAVRLPPVLRPFADGAGSVEVEVPADGTVGAVLTGLAPSLRRRLIDDQGALRRHVNVYLADDNIRDLAGLGTAVTPGDELLVLPSIAGG